MKYIMKLLISCLIITTNVLASQYHGYDDNIQSNWLKPLDAYLFNEGVDQMNKDVNPDEWIPTANGPRLDYLHDDVHNNPLNINLKPTDSIIIEGNQQLTNI